MYGGVYMNEDYLCHHGVKGMKWGRRKARSKSSGVKKSKKTSKKSNAKKQKILTDARKQTIKSVAKTTAKVAGVVAVSVILRSFGAQGLRYLADNYGTNTRWIDVNGNRTTVIENNSERTLNNKILGSVTLQKKADDEYFMLNSNRKK